jgi:hypothetical protein
MMMMTMMMMTMRMIMMTMNYDDDDDDNRRWKEYYMGAKVVTTLYFLELCRYPADTIVVFSDTDVLVQGTVARCAGIAAYGHTDSSSSGLSQATGSI